ncbi:MAG: DUF4127 family protein [Negativicutes bacterium]|nr:DUF4127 family protein [Negativicutes bacterium]
MNHPLRKFLVLTGYLLCASLFLSNCGLIPHAVASNPGKIAYVPLDNRPCNKERMIMAAKATGFDLLLPEEDLYATVLDGQPKNCNGTQYGDREALLDWIWKQDQAGCDFYVISFDQMMSGGLVQSRIMSDADLSEENAIIDSLTALAKKNRVIILSTLTRLAYSTPGYQGATTDDYYALYYYNLIPRPTLSGSELTIDNIIKNYRNKADGSKITADDLAAFGGYLTDEMIDNIVAVRERKLRLLCRMIQAASNGNLYYYIGIDDASSSASVQTSEIAFIKSLIHENGSIFSGADELAIMSLAKLSCEKYAAAVTANVFYFGGRADGIADFFDVNTLQENIEYHLSSAGCSVAADHSGEIDILVLTQPDRPDMESQSITDLIEKAKYNTEQQIPTIILDASTGTNDGNPAFGLNLVNKVNLAEIIGYSNWNTTGNRIGFSVGFGLARYNYLKNEAKPTGSASEGFLKYAAFQYIEDLAYCSTGRNYMSELINRDGNSNNFYPGASDLWIHKINGALEKAVMDGTGGASGSNIIANLNSGSYIVSLYDQYTEVSVKSFAEISVSGFRFPWYRSFEMTFEVDLTNLPSLKLQTA